MTPSDLKYHVEQANPDSFFFTRATMQFFGDTMKNYGVRSATVRTQYDAEGNYTSADGVEVETWELYRKRPVKHGLRSSHYFRKDNYKRVFPAQEV